MNKSLLKFSLLPLVLSAAACGSKTTANYQNGTFDTGAGVKYNAIQTTDIRSADQDLEPALINSYRDNDYIYHTFSVGYVSHVPVAPSESFNFNGGKAEAVFTRTETSTSTVKNSCTQATNLTTSVSSTLKAGLKASVKGNVGVVSAGVEANLETTVQSGMSLSNSLTKSYEETVSYSKSQSSSIHIYFDENTPTGNWILNLSATLRVYATVIFDASNKDNYNIVFESKIISNEYLFINTGSKAYIPDDTHNGKIEFNPNLDELRSKEVTLDLREYLENNNSGGNIDTTSPFYRSTTKSEKVKLERKESGKLFEVCTLSLKGIGAYKDLGYNTVSIKYSFRCWADGSLFGGAFTSGYAKVTSYIGISDTETFNERNIGEQKESKQSYKGTVTIDSKADINKIIMSESIGIYAKNSNGSNTGYIDDISLEFTFAKL